MDRESKRQALEAKKKKWMQDRSQALTKAEVKSPALSNDNRAPSSRVTRSREETHPPHPAHQHQQHQSMLDESLVSQLTERISKEIRKEINIGLGSSDIREAMTEKMDKYLESELHSHMCKTCSQLMLSPNHTPMLLVPCGHTFCKRCCEGKASRMLSVCPYCRSVCLRLLASCFLLSSSSLLRNEVQSCIVNQSLKDLIDQFASQREKVGLLSVSLSVSLFLCLSVSPLFSVSLL
jgi:hypothetical protein